MCPSGPEEGFSRFNSSEGKVKMVKKRRIAEQERRANFGNGALLSKKKKRERRYHFRGLAVNERIYEKRVLQKEDLKSGWHSAGSAVGRTESRHESSHLLKCIEFIEQLSDYQLLKKDCSMGLPNIPVEWVAYVHCTWVVLGLNLDSQTSYPTKDFRGFPPFFPTMNG